MQLIQRKKWSPGWKDPSANTIQSSGWLRGIGRDIVSFEDWTEELGRKRQNQSLQSTCKGIASMIIG